MENRDPFRRIKDKKFELKIGDDIVNVYPKTKDVEMFMTFDRDGHLNAEQASSITKILVDMVARANPNVERELIELHVVTNYGKYIDAVTILFGFATQEEIDRAKKKLREKMRGEEKSQ